MNDVLSQICRRQPASAAAATTSTAAAAASKTEPERWRYLSATKTSQNIYKSQNCRTVGGRKGRQVGVSVGILLVFDFDSVACRHRYLDKKQKTHRVTPI